MGVLVWLWEDLCLCQSLLLHISVLGPSVSGCEGSAAVCPWGGQEPASLQAGSLPKPSWRRPERGPRGSKGFHLQSALALIHFPSGWAGSPSQGCVSGDGDLCMESIESTSGFAVWLLADRVLMLCGGCPVWSMASLSLSPAVTALWSALKAGIQPPSLLQVRAQHPHWKVLTEHCLFLQSGV